MSERQQSVPRQDLWRRARERAARACRELEDPEYRKDMIANIVSAKDLEALRGISHRLALGAEAKKEFHEVASVFEYKVLTLFEEKRLVPADVEKPERWLKKFSTFPYPTKELQRAMEQKTEEFREGVSTV